MRYTLLGLLLLGLLSPLEGKRTSYNRCYDPCPYWACGGFEIGVEALYLRPSSCDYEYVVIDPRPFNVMNTPEDLPFGTHRAVKPAYDWGFRLSAAYLNSRQCEDIRFEYTRFHNGHNSTVVTETEGLWPTFGHPRYMVNTPLFTGSDTDEIGAFAQGHIHFDYDAVDLEYGSRALVSKRRCVWVRTFWGLHAAFIDHRLRTNYRGTLSPGTVNAANFENQTQWKRHSWGVGPRLGFDGRWESKCGIGLNGHIAFAAIGGEARDQALAQFNITPVGGVPTPVNQSLNVRFRHRHQLFPYIDTRMGIDYLLCRGRGYQVLFEVSYEFHTYINSLRHLRFNDERGTSECNCTNFNLDGFSLSLHIRL